MKIKRLILKMGGSKGITLPEEIAKSLAIGDKAVFDIKIVEVIGQERNYRCSTCGCNFFNEPKYAYCPHCGGKDLEVLE